MTGLRDGRHVPWYAVSGKTETGGTALPPPVRREPPATTAAAVSRLRADVDQFKTAVTDLLAANLRRFR